VGAMFLANAALPPNFTALLPEDRILHYQMLTEKIFSKTLFYLPVFRERYVKLD
jgi:hypothetical protein